jgi:hypothetical protein
MISIWEGCIDKIWDAIQFCRILDNLFFWSIQCLKPKVTHYLDQWRLRYCPEIPNLYSRLEKDVKTAETVHQIQDRLASLEIPPNNNLLELIQQTVVIQEVLRANLKKAKPNSDAKDEIESSKSDIPFSLRPKAKSPEVSSSTYERTEEGNSVESHVEIEGVQQEGALTDDSDNPDRIQSFSLQEKISMLQPESHRKHGARVTVLSGKSKESIGEGSITAEDSQGWSYTRTEFSLR